MRIIDISHSYYEGMPSYPSDWYPRFSISRAMTPGTDPSGTGRHFSHLHLFPHNGTHVESAFHFFADGQQIDQVPVERFVGRACIADLSHKGELEEITAADLDAAVGECWSGPTTCTAAGDARTTGTGRHTSRHRRPRGPSSAGPRSWGWTA
jgi:arylformamidase